MPGVVYTDIGDLINSTLAKMPKGKFAETMRETEVVLTKVLLTGAKSINGTTLDTRIRLRPKGTARFTNLYEVTPNVQVDLMGVASTPWGHVEEKMEFDEREGWMNMGAERIVELMEERRSGCYESLYFLVEDALVATPQNANDHKALRGLPYWFPQLGDGVEDPVGGFNATTIRFADGSTSTTCAGIDASDPQNLRWRPWAATHNGRMDHFLVEQIRRAMTRTNFMILAELKGQGVESGGRSRLCMGHEFADQYENMVNLGPDDRGDDVIPITGGKLRGVPVTRVPVMESLSYQPVWGFKTNKVYGRLLNGMWMRQGKAINDRNSTQVFTVPITGSCLVHCEDRRGGGFCIHAPMAA